MGVELATGKAGFAEIEEDVNFSDLDLAYYVRDALALVSSGDNNRYNELNGIFNRDGDLAPDEVAMLVTCLKALSGAVYYMDIVHHESLFKSIFKMNMWNYGPDVMDALVELIISLAASSGKYVDSCLYMLVSNFIPESSDTGSVKHLRTVARKEQVLSRLHAALKEIADLVPLAPLKLQDIVVQSMPFMSSSKLVIVLYVENMLRLESGALGEVVGSMMLLAVVDRLIDLDVEIGWEDILQDDNSKGIFEMELEEMEGAGDGADICSDKVPAESLSQKSFAGNIAAEKLDSLLVLTLEHLRSCYEEGRLIQVFGTLLHSFRKTIMTAYKSKFTQFMIFYACSLDPENCGVGFASMLVDTFMSSQSLRDRMSAVAYLASYLSRAKFLSASYVAIILKRLVDWCFEYCQVHDGDVNPEAHRVFYSACQAIMYVLCFRMRSMMGVPRLKSQLLLMPFEAVLKHTLNPLKVCLPSIVGEFLRQAKAAYLFTVSENFIFDDLLESELSRAFGGLERLDMFFPFDPCLLSKSDRFIRPNYIYWSLVRTTYDDDEEDSCDEDVENNGCGDRLNIMDDGRIASSFEEPGLDLDEFDNALNKMSITPKLSLNGRFGGELWRPAQMPSRIRPSTSPESL